MKMRLNEKGVNPVIAAILLVVITMVIGGLFAGWSQTYYQDQITRQDELSTKQIRCAEASFQINSCSFDAGDTNIATIQLENTGFVDLNEFTVVVEYSDGSSDVNINSLDLEEAALDNVFIQLDPGESPSMVKVASRECIDKTDHTTDCS